MSAQKVNVYGAIPATTRGKPVLIGGDPKGNNILYTVGNSVVIRNVKNPLICDYYNEHGYAPTVARYSPSGFYIASGDITGTVRIWDTTQETHPLKIELRPIGGSISDIAWSEDSKRLVCVGDGKEKYGAAFLFDTGASVGEITGHSKTITTCDFKKTRPYRVITGGEDFQVNWFEGPPFKYKFANKGHTRFVNCVRFNEQGTLAISVGSDKKGIFYDGKDGTPKHELSSENGHTGGIYCVSWAADGTRLLTASADKTAKVWDAETGKCISTHTFGNDVEDQQLGCIWIGEHLISMGLNGHLSYLDLNNTSKPRQVIKGHNKFITALAADTKNNTLYSGAYDAQVTGWDITTGVNFAVEGKGHTNQINQMFVAGDDLISAAKDDTVLFSKISEKKFGQERVGTDGEALAVSTNASGSTVVAVSNSTLSLIRNKKRVATAPLPFGGKTVALSGDEKEVIVGGADNGVYVFSINGDSLKQEKKLEGHRGPLSCAAYSPCGKYFATGDTNREIIVWDNATKATKVTGWVFHTARVNCLAWSPDSKHLASGSLDQNIICWNVDAPTTRIIVKNCHHGGVNAITWLTADTVASAGQDCAIRTHTFKY